MPPFHHITIRRRAALSVFAGLSTLSSSLLVPWSQDESMNETQAADLLDNFPTEDLDDIDSDGSTSLAKHLSPDVNRDSSTAVRSLRDSDDESRSSQADKKPASTKDITNDDAVSKVESTVNMRPRLDDTSRDDEQN